MVGEGLYDMGGVGCDDLRVANHPASCSSRERLPASACRAAVNLTLVDMATVDVVIVGIDLVDIVLVGRAPANTAAVDPPLVDTTAVNLHLAYPALVYLVAVNQLRSTQLLSN